MFDGEGNLTAEGLNILDQLENDQMLKGYSFGDYLSENDPDLYNWATSENMYNYSTDALGNNTNAQMVREMLGTGDEKYTGVERLAGLTEGELSEQYNKLKSAVDSVRDWMNGGKTKQEDAVNNYTAVINDMIALYGLENDFDQLLKEKGYENVNDFINKALEAYASAGTETSNAVFDKAGGYYNIGLVSPSINYEDEIKLFDDLVVNLATMVKDKRDNFYGEEISKGAVQSSYNSNIWDNKTYSDFMMSDGKRVSYLSSATLKGGSNIRNVDGDNFTITYDGKDYSLEAGKETLDAKTVVEVNKYVRESAGRQLRKGDVFIYNDRLWVITNKGTARVVQDQWLRNDAKNLMGKLGGINVEDVAKGVKK
jgi:hypothetical protein